MERLDQNSELLLVSYISLLRFLYLYYQNAHWSVKGLNFYNSHLLFQRLYEGVQENVDATAEKIMGNFSNVYLDLNLHLKFMQDLNQNKKVEDSFVDFAQNALSLEGKLQKISSSLKESLTSLNLLSLGLDDLLASQANDGETRMYLLKQSLTS